MELEFANFKKRNYIITIDDQQLLPEGHLALRCLLPIGGPAQLDRIVGMLPGKGTESRQHHFAEFLVFVRRARVNEG